MRKVVSALVIAAGLALAGGPANAQPYPPVSSQGLAISQSTVGQGGSVVVAGSGAKPGATVVFTLSRVSPSSLGAGARVVAAGPGLTRTPAAVRSLAQGEVVLGRAIAADDGSFRTTMVRIPLGTQPGSSTLTASSGGQVLGMITIRVFVTSTAALALVGALPFTGTDVGPGLALGIGLIVAGGLLLLTVRRRRSTA